MITPIIMESDMAVVAEKIKLLQAQKRGKVHIDIGDGLFSDLLSIAPADLQEVNLEGLTLDMHLLVDDPVEWVEECVALQPARVIAQIERMGSQRVFMETVAGYGSEAGLALKIETPIEAIENEVLEEIKTILLLEIPPGTTGSPFDMRVIAKIKSLRAKYAGQIVVDGGIDKNTYKLVIAAGANEAGANSAWWRGEWTNK